MRSPDNPRPRHAGAPAYRGRWVSRLGQATDGGMDWRSEASASSGSRSPPTELEPYVPNPKRPEASLISPARAAVDGLGAPVIVLELDFHPDGIHSVRARPESGPVSAREHALEGILRGWEVARCCAPC